MAKLTGDDQESPSSFVALSEEHVWTLHPCKLVCVTGATSSSPHSTSSSSSSSLTTTEATSEKQSGSSMVAC